MKKLYRSRTNKSFAGILGGVGEYFSIDPVILRAIFVVLMFVTGFFPMLIAYVICMFIIPLRPESEVIYEKAEEVKKEEPVAQTKTEDAPSQ